MKLTLIRHGRTEGNEKRLYYGRTDLPLLKQSVWELEALGRLDIYPKADRYYTSGMLRTEQTLEALYGPVPHEKLPDMREIDFGDFEMRTYEDLKRDPAYQAWISGDNEANVCPGGESGVMVTRRALRCLGPIISAGEDAVIITHGGVIGGVMAVFFPGPHGRYRFTPEPGEGFTAEFINGRPVSFKKIPKRRQQMMTERAKVSRIMIAGTGSGCGKTTVTCAVLQALKNRGIDVGAAKCGPDYIDPMFHRKVIGAPSTNLDPFFCSDNTLRFLLAKNGAGRALTVIEGVMGYYDGLGLVTAKASAFDVAGITKTPVILTVNAKGASLSILAQIKGFSEFMPDSGIKGVILNNCTERVYSALAPEIGSRLGIKPLGFLPRMAEAEIGSRHLGLITANEITDIKQKLSGLAEQAERSIDIDGIIKLAGEAPELEYDPVKVEKREPVRLAVARDGAFCFYYEDSLDLLRQMGAELVMFSPLEEARLPEGINGLYLGGGYPELYKEKLSANLSMRESIRLALENGLPCVAECGGFMYLTEAIGESPMVGFIKGKSFDNGKLTRFGYVTLTAQEENLLCRAGESIPAHEFHHWDAEDQGSGFAASKPDGRGWPCVHTSETLCAGFPHIHFYADPKFAEGFYNAMLKEKHRV